MAIDGIYLYSLVEDLKNAILNSKIDKINQPEKDEIILTIRKDRKNIKLLISASSKYPRIHFTEGTKNNPLQAPMFTMVLRKYLIGGRILDITQSQGDRIIQFHIESSDEMGFNSMYTLIVEIMGRHSNITLVRNRDEKVMECIKHISPSINSYRVLYPGVTYKYPPQSNKLNPFEFSEEMLCEYISNENIEFDEYYFMKIFTGISKPLSIHLFNLYNTTYKTYTTYNIIDFLKNFIIEIKEKPCHKIYLDSNKDIIDFYCINLSQYNSQYTSIDYNNHHELLDKYFIGKDKQERIKSRSINLHRLVTTNIDRCIKKSIKLNNSLEKCKDKESFKILGDLVTSYIYNIKKGDTEIKVYNFYSEANEEVTIVLDPNKTPSENVQSYYKKYNKLKKAEEAALEQLELNNEELNYLNSVLTNIDNCDSYDEIEEIKEELISSGYIRKRKINKASKKTKALKPLHFVSSEGIDIYVGKNNLQNDNLSLKFANKNHMWLHTKNIPGSHVIVCAFDIPDTTLVEAATIAAHFSKAKVSTKVPVDYTLVKNLKKPNGSKPGMVIYHTNYTMYVEPTEFEKLNVIQK